MVPASGPGPRPRPRATLPRGRCGRTSYVTHLHPPRRCTAAPPCAPQALATYEAGLKHDPESAELRDGAMRCVDAINRMAQGQGSEEELAASRAKAMEDPEIQGILRDPVMQQVGAGARRGGTRGGACTCAPRGGCRHPQLLVPRARECAHTTSSPPPSPPPHTHPRQVLEDLQTDPRAAQKHMAHPEIRGKISKLIAAGIIQTR